jgi:hypothetical protein
MNIGGFQPGYAALPTSTVELSVRCDNLTNKDILSKSDPVCVLYIKGGGSSWLEFARTERLQDTLNPVWNKKFIIDYKFEERQVLKFSIYDIDSESSRLEDHDFLGSTEASLGEIVAAQSKGFSKNLQHGNGSLHVVSEELLGNKENITFSFSGRKLDKKDMFGKSDPYMEISRVTENNKYIIVHRTEVIKNTLNPDWKKFRMEVRTLCNGDYDRDLKFSVFDWDSNDSPDYIGSFHTTLNKLKTGSNPNNAYDCINEEKQKKKGSKYKNSGTIILNSVCIESVTSFLDYIQGGTQVNFTVAVDFTGSNGAPNQPSSLHYMDPTGRPNQYQTAIASVGEIIQDYDSDKQFPCLGFGARVPPHGQVSHEFFLTLTDTPFCQGLQGILAAYQNSLHNVQLYGPTNFSPVIRHVARFAQAYQTDPSNYFVLLIITDGIITDLEETKHSIIQASRLPLSIIIVGVGDEDFSAMDALDSDDRLLRAGGMVAARDIVQFVELRKFLSGGYWSKELLAKAVLAEIPSQLSGWMKLQSLQPAAH